MLSVIWDTRNYLFWLIVVSLFCFIIERIVPWRSEQKAFRKEFWQDLFFLIFNGHYAGILLAFIGSWLLQKIDNLWLGLDIPDPETIELLGTTPIWVQFIFYLLVADFLNWCIHVLLHRVPWLWEFHKLHHSIEELDWIGHFRFHWMEIVVYKGLTYFPLVVLGVEGQIILWIAVFNTLIGHLNHSNINLGWGPFNYIFNSPRFHVWHHDYIPHGRYGKNFGLTFTIWDWLFGTAYLPEDKEQPRKLGFEAMTKFPTNFIKRLFYPVLGKDTSEE